MPSITDWVHTDIRGWTLAGKLTDAQFDEMLPAAERELAKFVAANGTVSFASPALIVSARKR